MRRLPPTLSGGVSGARLPTRGLNATSTVVIPAIFCANADRGGVRRWRGPGAVWPPTLWEPHRTGSGFAWSNITSGDANFVRAASKMKRKQRGRTVTQQGQLFIDGLGADLAPHVPGVERRVRLERQQGRDRAAVVTSRS